MDWRTLATSYGFEIVVIILLINIGFIWPERLQLAQKESEALGGSIDRLERMLGALKGAIERGLGKG